MRRRRFVLMPLLIRVALVAAAVSCAGQPEPEAPVGRAFYYWRTTFHLSTAEQRALDELHVTRLYVRMFDIDWNDAPVIAGPIAPSDTPIPKGIDAVPVVFVKDAVFRHVDKDYVASLAATAWNEITTRAHRLGFEPHEVQLDCDWTDGTREAYFEFIRRLREIGHVHASATIRLHQIKYRERTGVPPVERGMLMFYNMGKFSADADARVIFDADSAERYLARIGDYPLPLDVALPIWSWTLHVRDDRVVGLMQSTDPDELASIPFLKRAGDDRYVVTESSFLHGTLLRAGDILKIEVTGPTETRAAADMVAPRLARTPRTVTLFDLSERNLARHGVDTLDQVYRAIH